MAMQPHEVGPQPVCFGHQQPEVEVVGSGEPPNLEKAEITELPTLLRVADPDEILICDKSRRPSDRYVHPLLQAAPAISDCISFVHADAVMGLTSPIPRCQELPRSAFGHLRPGDILVSVSHGWRYQGHPDPTGEKLDVIKRHIRTLQDSLTTQEPVPRILMFLDFLSITQRPFAVYQPDRTEEEQRLFLEALKLMHWVYLRSDHVIHVDIVVSDVPDHGDVYTAEMSDGVDFLQLGTNIQVSHSASPQIGIFDEIVDLDLKHKILFELGYTDDWAARLQSKFDATDLESDDDIWAIDKHGNSYDVRRSEDHIELNPIPEPQNFPLEFQAISSKPGSQSGDRDEDDDILSTAPEDFGWTKSTTSCSLAVVKRVSSSRSRVAGTFRKMPFGKCNMIPVADRGWVYLERFITAAKIACQGEKSLKSICITESQETLQWMRETARLLNKSFLSKSEHHEVSRTLAGSKRELCTKLFSAASVDKQKMDAGQPPSRDAAIVADLMEDICERLLKERKSEIAQQRSRAAQQSTALRILSAGSTSLLDLLFGPPRFYVNPDLLSVARGNMKLASSHSQSYLSLRHIFGVLIGSGVSAYAGFVIIPLHDIRHDATVTHWYECALSCSLIFTPLLICLAIVLANCGFFRPVLGSPLGVRFFFKASVAAAWSPFPIIWMTTHYIAYPAVWIMSPIYATASIIMVHVLLLLEIPNGHRRKHLATVISLGIFQLLLVLYLLFILGMAGLSSLISDLNHWLASIAAALILPFGRKLGGKLLVLLGSNIHHSLGTLAVFWACIMAALVTPLAMGSTSALGTAILMAFADVFVEMLALLTVVPQDLHLCGWTLTHEDYVLLASTPLSSRLMRQAGVLEPEVISRELIRQYEGRWLVHFLSLEQGDALAPLIVLTFWTVLFFSENSISFAGIGIDEYGWTRPDSTDGSEMGRVTTLYKNTGIFILLNMTSLSVINRFFRKRYNLGLGQAQTWILDQYGWELIFFTVFAVYQLFCGLMIACGVDTSFSMKALVDPWEWFTSDTLPQLYVKKGFPATRP
eukprot:TRINITY_DN3064_c0_g1_i2.p1 TRINITY_DN3064_c0_g1~~TRINITY_DN3064_c0_g1_i2.p1  ORF type:complete len:1041 (-),score=136.31 TRINITY_DN3064_c0_g1_i2:169-3291(-)